MGGLECKNCGKPYKQKKFTVADVPKVLNIPDCDCEVKEQEQQEMARSKKRRSEILQGKFANSLMTPLFKNYTFENVNLDKTEHIITCEKYVKDFSLNKSEGIAMIGNVGTGKSVALACICNALISKGHNCLFTTMSALLDKFIESCDFDNDITIESLYRWVRQFDFVVLDDLGRETYTKKRLEIAFRIVDELINYQKVIAFSANPETLEKIHNIPEFDAIRDRLAMACRLKLLFKGESYRRKI